MATGGSVFLVMKVTFDGMENRLSAAIASEVVGYLGTMADAESFVARQKAGTFEGWDHEKYPKFEILPVRRLTP